MHIYMRSNIVLVVGVLLTAMLIPGQLQAQHPFLIVTEANYPTLQALASQSPWSGMKADAISNATSLTYNTGDNYFNKTHRMDDIASACALAYILDVGNRSTYVNKMYNTIMTGWPDLRSGLTNNNFQRVVLPGIAYFNTVLALDVMYNGFTSGEITDMENELQLVADWYNSNNTPWQLNLYACRGIWALYTNNRSDIDQTKADYRNELFNTQVTTDGVARMGPGYAGVRLSQERESKANFMDVLDFTGEDTYYTDPNAINLMEWLYGYGTTPFRKFYTFGDTAPNRSYHEKGASTFRAHRFSDKAGRYAAWINNGIPPAGRLLHYVLMDQQLLTPERGPSRIFPDGGAWFVETGLSDRALSAALWNPMSSESHSHSDVSAIHLAAYGEHVIRNSGYAGWDKPSGYWTYIHDEAYSNSVVLINDTDHATKYGAGIIEGFTAPSFNYACSDSGPAISNGNHYRNLLFIHPYGGVNGYWLLFDEVDADNSSHKANVLLHPNADNMSTVSSNKEYQSQISDVTYSGHTVYISIFLGTAPASTSINDGVLAHMSNQSFTGKYLYSDYNTDGSGLVNIVTVLFPHDDTHAKAAMTRISGTDYTGASIAQSGSVEDIALESSAGAGVVTYNGLSFSGLAAWYRLESGLMTSYFVRKGNYLDDGSTPSVGFDSSSDISIYMEDANGRIVSPGTNVTFYYPGILGVSLNGSPLSNASSGADWVQVNIPSGTHQVQFEFSYPADFDSDDDVDLADFAIFASAWRTEPGDGQWNPDCDISVPADDSIDTLDLAVFTTYWLEGAVP